MEKYFNKSDLYRGKEVEYSGFRASVYEVHSGQLDGMVTLMVPGGQTCVDISELRPYNANQGS